MKNKDINTFADLDFKKIFEQELSQSSLKHYRDLKNVMDTSFEEGKLEGIMEGKMEVNREIAKNMKTLGFALSQITKIIGLTETEIAAL